MEIRKFCFCCLQTPAKKRSLYRFKATERRDYSELTRNEIQEDAKPKICSVCRERLKSAADFVQLCKNSLNSQLDVILPTPETPENGAIIITVCEQNDNSFSTDDEDDIPISIIREQQQQQAEEVVEEHEEIIELEIEKISDIEEEEALIKRKRHRCQKCNKLFSSKQKLLLHDFTHTGTKDWQCAEEGCEKKFATEARLKSHSRVHSNEKPYLCDVCSLSFAQSNALKCHKRTHTNERPYACPYENCGKRFSQNTILKTHVAARHEEVKCVKCDVPGCTKKFPRNSFLIQHKKRDHENKRDYVCTKCDKAYKQQSHLTRHVEATHSNIRHSCPVCNKSFSKSWSLKMHSFSHMESSKFPYKCSECEMAFQRRDKWLKHMSKQHPDVDNFKRDPIEINLPPSSS